MESIRSAIANVERGDFLASVDLQDAYLHIPILRAHRKYLRIALLLDHQILHFQFTCLPFGITSAPRVFTKVVVVLTAALRLQGICVTPYLDDWLVRAPSEAVLKQHLHKTLQMLDTHGFLVNLKKSSLDPTPVISYLGFTIDTFLMKLSLSDQRTTNLQRAVQGLLQTDHCSVRKAMRILGMMTSSLEAVPWARAHFRMLQNCILTQWDKSRDSLERNINISLPVKKDLLWWLHPQRFLQGRSLKTQIQTVLTSDASGSAWGAHVEDHWVQEAWSQKELQMSSNLKELTAIRKALIHFKSKVLHKAVQVQSDNLAAVFYLNKQGGTRSPSMQKECALIMRWAEENLLSLSAIHIRGVDNVRADWLSRNSICPGEWELNPLVFRKITSMWGLPDLDAMANSRNKKLLQFCLLSRVGNPLAIDALSINWKKFFVYIFPPIPMIPKVLQKIRDEKVRAIAILPFWPRRAWFPLALNMAKNQVWKLPIQKDLLLQSEMLHPDLGKLQLAAWNLNSEP